MITERGSILNIQILFDKNDEGGTSTARTVIKNETTGKFAGTVSTTYSSDHNAPIDRVLPPGVEDGTVLSKEKPVSAKNAEKTKKPVVKPLSKPQDVGIPAWLQHDVED